MATAQLLHHLSLAPPSTQAWSDALCLYQQCIVQVVSSSPVASHRTAGVRGDSRTLDSAAGTSPFLKAMRHMALTTLLQAGEWDRALRFYGHTLYQQDLPGPVTTGFLVQRLGEGGRWADVMQVYELSVKLLIAQRHRRTRGPARISPEGAELLARKWGTTLSMAMSAVQRCSGAPSSALQSMLQPLVELSRSSTNSPTDAKTMPLVMLDAHFLSAVQALPHHESRLTVLRTTRQAGLLDYFKLIRGLLSKGKWIDALYVFADSVRREAPVERYHLASSLHHRHIGGGNAGEEESYAGSRSFTALKPHEVAQSRMNFLHTATAENVAKMVAALHACRCKYQMDCQSHPLQLTKKEVECVLSKSLECNTAAPCIPPQANHAMNIASTTAAASLPESLWRFCLDVLSVNYSEALGSIPSLTSTLATATAPEREERPSLSSAPLPVPSPAMLSLLFHNSALPWPIAVHLLERCSLIPLDALESGSDPWEGCRLAFPIAEMLSPPRRHVRPSSSSSASPDAKVLALCMAAKLLRRQGQPERANRLSLCALQWEMEQSETVSISAEVLQHCSIAVLQHLLLFSPGVCVHGRVLFHLLRSSVIESSGGGEGSGEQCGCGASGVGCEGVRALWVVSLLMRRGGFPDLFGTPAVASYTPVSCGVRPQQHTTVPTTNSAAAAAAATTLGASGGGWPSTWQESYEPSIHVETIRLIHCTATSKMERWRLILRYLHCLTTTSTTATANTASHEDNGGARLFSEEIPNGPLPPEWTVLPSSKSKAGYFAAIYEAVVSLLNATSPAMTSEGIKPTVLEPTGPQEVATAAIALPENSKEQVRLLGQLLERAMGRYDYRPPTHMLLPNQLDRLLPPIGSGKVNSISDGVTEMGAVTVERLRVATRYFELLMNSLAHDAELLLVSGTSGTWAASENGIEQSKRLSIEPAFLHNLLKLCCRLAEHWARVDVEQLDGGSDIPSLENLSSDGARLVRLQCDVCGLHTIYGSSLKLLYSLCAVRAFGVSHSTSRWELALETTAFLLNRCEAAAAGVASDTLEERDGSLDSIILQRRRCGERLLRQSLGSVSAIQAEHCHLYFKLFGWETGLRLWYAYFPSEVVQAVSGNTAALDACLRMSEALSSQQSEAVKDDGSGSADEDS